MRRARLITNVLIAGTMVAFVGCTKLEDEKRETVSSAVESTAPAEHEVVVTIRNFLRAIDDGDYDQAIGMSAPGEFDRDWLIKFRDHVEVGQVEVLEAYVGKKEAVVVTTLPAKARGKKGKSGYELQRNGDRWVIRDTDFLPNNDAVDKWITVFKARDPNAKRVARAD